MSLQNLLAIQRLQTFEATPGGVQRLLASAARNLVDARLTGLSADNRFDAAYTRQWLAGHRPALIATDR